LGGIVISGPAALKRIAKIVDLWHNTPPMGLPKVAIVGRPNVGKSSLLNRLVRRRIAIVQDLPGVTRDRIHVPWALDDGENAPYVELVDTGGMGIEDMDNLTDHVEEQIAYAIGDADMILFMVDARQGIAPLDRHVAEILRKQNKPVILVASKVDYEDMAGEVGELHKLGFGEPHRVSAKHSVGLEELREAVRDELGHLAGEAPDEGLMKLAVVGKRNAGKSTFINHIAGQQRVIVSETPGTTRDSVDVHIKRDGREFIVIDTAGVRKTRKLANDIEYYSQHRALRSIRRADVVALMIDASLPVSQVDKDLAGAIVNENKPVVIVVNKWDLARETTDGEDYLEYFAKTFPHLSFAPISLTTALTGENVWETVDLAEELYVQSRTRVPTAQLNDAIEDILALRGPSHKAGTRPPKIRYASQVAVTPPTIVIFVNDPRSFDQSYQRFLINQLRERLPFGEVPMRLMFRRGKDRHKDF
jgi:GTP-binding protein